MSAPTRVTRLLAVLLFAAFAVAGAWPSSPDASSPFKRDDPDGAARSSPATASPRLRRAAEALRRDPLYVDPELAWMVDAEAQRGLRRRLVGARVPVLVAVLPSVDEDESGGDTRRTLQALQRLVGRDAVYVAAEQRGWFDVGSVGIPLDLSIPYSLAMPSRITVSADGADGDRRRETVTTLAARLEKMLGYVAAAGPGSPNGIIDDVSDLDPLPGSEGYDVTEDVVAAAVMGTILGLIAAAVVLGIRRLVVGRRTAAGGRSGGKSRGGGRGAPGRASGGGRRSRAGRGGRGTRRRGRRGA